MARVETALAREGLEVWRDVNIEPGANWSNELYTWLMECSGAVVLLGKDSTVPGVRSVRFRSRLFCRSAIAEPDSFALV
jgi:hypothetical protein